MRQATTSAIQLGSIIVACTLLAIPNAAHAASPSVVIASAPLVDPATALSTYGSPASPTAKSTRDPLVQEASRALKYDVDLIYEHVRDNVDTLPMFGLLKGGRGVALDGKGTAFDQAQFMVDALREADAAAGKGYNPSYALGKITLSASEFAAWTGIGDAAIASKYLANAGVPASVSGSGSSFTVTMLHIWVRATIGGSNYLFDPSYKPSTAQTGLNWQANSGYSKATLQSYVTAPSTTVTGFSRVSFKSALQSYRANLENYIATNAAGKRAEAVVGTSQIVPHTTAEDRRTSLPYVTSSDRSWSGEIPDAFRTTFTVKLNNQTYASYFADEKGGLVLPFSYTGSGSTFTASTPANGNPAISGSFLGECEGYLGSRSSASAIVDVVINHPYVANGGTYADRTISRKIARQQCSGGGFYISNDWGFVGDGISKRIGTAASLIRSNPQRRTEFIFAPTLASVASQYSSLLDLATHAQGNIYQMHDLVGIHVIDNAHLNLDSGAQEQNDSHTFLSMSFESAVSAFAKSGLAAADSGAAYTAGLGLAIAEAAVPRQESDAVYDMAALSLFSNQNSRSESGTVDTTYLATPGTWSSVSSSLTDWQAEEKAAPQGYTAEGYTVLVPKYGDLRQPPITVVSQATRTAKLGEGSNSLGTGGEIKLAPFLAFRPSSGAGSPPDRIAVSIYDQHRGGILKAGVGVATITGAASPIQRPEPPKSESKDVFRSALNVDPRTGSLSYSPPVDISDGSGGFPRSLELRRVYDAKDLTNYGMGVGWKSNWYQVATLSNDGQAALGRSGAAGVASALVMLQAMGDLAAGQSARDLFAAMQVASWFTDQTINNTVLLHRGLESPETFYKLANGTSFVSGRPDGSTLTYTGTPVTGIINRRLYHGHSVSYTDGSGSVRTYKANDLPQGVDLSSPAISGLYSRKSFYLDNWAFPDGTKIKAAYFSTVQAPDVVFLQRVTNNHGAAIGRTGYDPGSTTGVPFCATPGGFVEWTAPTGASLKYGTAAGSEIIFGMSPQVAYELVGYPEPEFARCAAGSTTPSRIWSSLISGLNGMRDTSGSTWAYGYTAPADNPGSIFGHMASLKALYKPSLLNTPALVLTYGKDGNVRTLTDASNGTWNYHSSPFRSEVISPSQAAAKAGSVTYFDRNAQAIRSIDPLGRATVTSFDDRGRPTTVTRPEGNQTVTTYDVRNNVLTETLKAKPGAGLSDRVTVTTYMEGATASACASIARCNKPQTVTDANGNRSDYDWHMSTGNLMSVTRGLNAAGNCQIGGGTCPQTSLTYITLAGYNPFDDADNGTLVLSASKQERVDAANTTTTAYEWALKDFSPATYVGVSNRPVKRIQVTGVISDSGGLNLRTCYTSDLGGNVIAVSDPRETVCDGSAGGGGGGSGVSFSVSDPSVAEGGLLGFVITKTGTATASHSVTVATANGTASTNDYNSFTGTFAFAVNETSKTVSIATVDDTNVESSETVRLNLSNPTGGAAIGDAQGTGTIVDNDESEGGGGSDEHCPTC